LHYVVTDEAQISTEGTVETGDANGKTVMINNFPGDEENARVVIKDSTNQIIFDGKVTYYGDWARFVINTDSLDSKYKLRTIPFSVIHAISFNIQS